MRITCITPPTSEPVTVSEVKEHRNIDSTADDTKLETYIKAARIKVEKIQKRQLMQATWKLSLDAFPASEIVLPKPPLQSVSSIKYLDQDGTQQTLSTDYYSVDTAGTPGRITLNYDYSWPSTRAITNVVEITFVCGYSSASTVPETTKVAIMQYAAHLHAIREPVVTGTIATVIPLGFDALVTPGCWGDYR